MTDAWLYDLATGEIIQRAAGGTEALEAMLSGTVGAVPYVAGTSDLRYKVDIVTGQLVHK